MFLEQDIIDAFNQNHWVITPNNRLSNTWIERFHRLDSLKTRQKPLCFPYKRLLYELWDELIAYDIIKQPPMILSAHHTHYLWKKICITLDTTPATGLIQELERAWQLIHTYNITTSDSEFFYTEQTEFFASAATLFHENLSEYTAISEAQMAAFIAPFLKELAPRNVLWACFDDMTPEQLILQKESPHWTHTSFDLPKNNFLPSCHAANNELDELQTLSLWIEHEKNIGSTHIGIVIPDLEQCADSLIPQLTDQCRESINVSVGRPLSSYPMVAHALHLLGLSKPIWTYDDISLFLYSPYIKIKGNVDDVLTWFQATPFAKEQKTRRSSFLTMFKNRDPNLSAALLNMAPNNTKKTLIAWTECFIAELNALGFPGGRGLSSKQHQLFERFLNIFDEIKTFSLLKKEWSRKETLELLHSLTKNTVFQPKMARANIHVMGLLEASGITFDALFVMHMNAEKLPAKGRLSPFIPISIQKNKALPYASHTKELRLAKTIINRLSVMSPKTVFSYSMLIDDMAQKASVFIRDLPPYLSEKNPSKLPTILDNYEETYLVPFSQNEPIKGGTSLLAYQAECPFKSFAKHRLNSQKNDLPSDGIPPILRGQLLHQALYYFWKEITSQKQLLSLSEAACDDIIDVAISESLRQYASKFPDTFTTLMVLVEKKRLKNLIYQSLEFEKKRAPFTIAELEEQHTITLLDIPFQVRLDRLDTVENNHWLIDYKTSLPVKRPWDEPRPEAPQLLMYALLNDSIDTLLFIGLNKGQLNIAGFSEKKQDFRDIKITGEDSWQTQLHLWKARLESLLQEFLTGYVKPSPLREDVCLHCDYSAFCQKDLIPLQKLP